MRRNAAHISALVAQDGQTALSAQQQLLFHASRARLCHQCHQRLPLHSTLISAKTAHGRAVVTTSQAARRAASSWATAVKTAQNLVSNVGKASTPELPGGVKIDPFRTVAKEMKFLTKNMQQLLGSSHPVLDTVAKYYTQAEGKHIRPMLVLLMSQATALCEKATTVSEPYQYPTHQTINTLISPSGVLSDVNPSEPGAGSSNIRYDESHLNLGGAASSAGADSQQILPSQRRLAEITELIHTASLLHDDVIDHSTTRRSLPSANLEFGNKMAVLAGDFLLGRASVALARLRSPEVTELLATVIANLIEGEFMQLRNTALDEIHPTFHPHKTLEYYLQKTYLKSASLISKSCRAAALLGNSVPEAVEAAYSYGRNLGLAFQLIDDMLDYTSTGAELGKPSGGADLELGLATAPLLFAWRSHDLLGELIGRKFSQPGDITKAREIVLSSDGLEQTRALAQEYADKAVDAIAAFPDSPAKSGLQEMCATVMNRRR